MQGKNGACGLPDYDPPDQHIHFSKTNPHMLCHMGICCIEEALLKRVVFLRNIDITN